jgi:hypothetical protein
MESQHANTTINNGESADMKKQQNFYSPRLGGNAHSSSKKVTIAIEEETKSEYSKSSNTAPPRASLLA